ncbi:MAG: high-potential iron-sulfur protein [Candidatus Eremiobacteraeota bacterium]|nr:high-potential iron-sulfur protein [Candidatus Eremiobacteraeota bacterium]MBV9737716.1 high-potential iron-sulfur protein [Candidatus Eremiobacteraeota bacterium]
MNDSRNRISRSDALKGIIVLPALAVGFGALTLEAEAAKASKASVKYQSHPKGSQKCAGCRFFIKGKTASANGACQVVAGSISPNGWCVSWAKK